MNDIKQSEYSRLLKYMEQWSYLVSDFAGDGDHVLTFSYKP